MPPNNGTPRPVRLAFTRTGRGPPLLFLHGFLGSGRNWKGIARALSDRFTCLLVDLRNHGASPWAEPMTYEAMAADVAALLEAEGLEEATVLGHSMGGKAAMTLALEGEPRLRALIVVDIAPVPYRRRLEPLLDALLAVDLARFRSRAEVDAALRPAIPEDPFRGFLLQNLERGPEGLRWRCNLPVLRRWLPAITGFPPALEGRRWEGPVLFLRGERSDYVEARHLPRIRALFPRARIVTLEGAGHWPQAERPEETRRALEAFLSEATGDAPRHK